MLGFLKKKIKETVEKVKKKEIIEEPIKKSTEIKNKEKPLEKIKPEKKTKEKTEELKPEKKIKGGLKEKDIEDFIWDLHIALLESDVATEVSEKICDRLKEDLLGEKIKKKDIEDVINDSLKESLESILSQEPLDLIEKIKSSKKPFKILFIGFNGVGKTTTIARLANLLKNNNLKPVMAAADTWRAAAIQQLEKHGDNLDVKVISHDYGSDAAAVIFDAVNHAKSKNLDVVLADTAGRAHTNSNLMEELEKICRVNEPDMILLVVDSLTGNDAVEQASVFSEKIGIDGIILTKMDVNEKGGAAISIAHTLNKPIIYMGIGQEYEDLKKFDPKEIIKAILS